MDKKFADICWKFHSNSLFTLQVIAFLKTLNHFSILHEMNGQLSFSVSPIIMTIMIFDFYNQLHATLHILTFIRYVHD